MSASQVLGTLGALAALLVAVSVLVGIGVRLMLLPWLREHLVGPLLERLDTLAHRLESVSGRLESMSGDMRVASRMYEGHIEASGEDRANLWAAVTELRELIPRHRRRLLPPMRGPRP